MDYEEHICRLVNTIDGRLYIMALAGNLKESGDIKSLQYLKACVMVSGSSNEVSVLSGKIQSMIDDINVE